MTRVAPEVRFSVPDADHYRHPVAGLGLDVGEESVGVTAQCQEMSPGAQFSERWNVVARQLSKLAGRQRTE